MTNVCPQCEISSLLRESFPTSDGNEVVRRHVENDCACDESELPCHTIYNVIRFTQGADTEFVINVVERIGFEYVDGCVDLDSWFREYEVSLSDECGVSFDSGWVGFEEAVDHLVKITPLLGIESPFKAELVS
jgi:hypothetical protein